jgi:hypothetical protein
VRATGEGRVVGDQGIARQRFEREPALVRERMVLRHDHPVLPAVPGQRQQPGIAGEGLGGDPDIRRAGEGHFGDLRRIAL